MLLILSDSREQEPLVFDRIKGVDKVEVIGLPFGDYTAMIDGKQVPICFDRKSISDLYSTMTHGYERWKKVMQKAKDAGHKLILITEGTYSDVKEGYSHSEFSGEAMIKKLHTLMIKYELDWWPCENRRVMASRIVDTFLAVARHYEQG